MPSKYASTPGCYLLPGHGPVSPLTFKAYATPKTALDPPGYLGQNFDAWVTCHNMWNGSDPVRVCCPATQQEIDKAIDDKLKALTEAAKKAAAAATAHGPTRRRPIPRAYGAGQGPGSESGWWPVLAWVGKLVLNVGAFMVAEWGISELIETEEEIDAKMGKKGTPQAQGTGVDDPLSSTGKSSELSQVAGLKARGEALLSGPYLPIYLNMLYAWKKKIEEGALTGRESAALRTLLYKYTLKHGNCAAPAPSGASGSLFLNPDEVELCKKYKKAHPPGAPAASSGDITAASAKAPAPKWLPWILIGGAAALIFFMTKDKK